MNISLIGNPNSGKSTIFNLLTGKNQKTGNWSGVTINKKSECFKYKNNKYSIIDLPGIYSIDQSISKSSDEIISINYIKSGESDIFINVIDASNLEKSLFLTTELLDLEKPMILILNMNDVAKEKSIKIDSQYLSKKLGIEVILMSANKEEGIIDLKNSIEKIVKTKEISKINVGLPPKIEEAIEIIKSKTNLNRWNIIKYLQQQNIKSENQIKFSTEEKSIISSNSGEKIDFIIINKRYKTVNNIINSISDKEHNFTINISDKIDQIILNPFIGAILFFATLYLLFFTTINIGGAFIDFFDIIAKLIFVDIPTKILNSLNSPQILTLIIANGIGGAIQTLSNFIPIIFFLYLFLSLLENTGYMSRLAFVASKFTNWAGLPGKSFISLIMGFGCSVPAIMSSRTLSSKKHRIITIFMIPFISCGAKLPVYILFIAAFFPKNGQNIIFLLYLIGIVIAILTGIIINKSIGKGNSNSMILDLPRFSLPNLTSIIFDSYLKVKNFIFGAGKILIPLIFILTIFNSIGTDFSFKRNNHNSILVKTAQFTTPIFYPLGIKEDNWQAVVAILTGLIAKEIMIGTLDNLYKSEIKQKYSEVNLMEEFKSSFTILKHNLIDLKNSITDPLSINIAKNNDLSERLKKNEVEMAIFRKMREKFDGKIGAFAFLLFILLYAPCMTAMVAASREIGKKWSSYSAIYATLIAYFIATAFYQIGSIFI